ncbi:hypothetical protein [Streptomyces sp. CWNU-52B]|uniref:hypothetical protein n=1 Tax=unclassified Streptomyces TaxID=2593676 RepID=UPI0039C119BC
MSRRIARLFEPVLQLLFPGTGRRRRPVDADAPVDGWCSCPPCMCGSVAEGPTTARVGSRPLRGEDHAMVRPYLVDHERRRRGRQRALRLAVHGVDLGPRPGHGVEVTV